MKIAQVKLTQGTIALFIFPLLLTVACFRKKSVFNFPFLYGSFLDNQVVGFEPAFRLCPDAFFDARFEGTGFRFQHLAPNEADLLGLVHSRLLLVLEEYAPTLMLSQILGLEVGVARVSSILEVARFEFGEYLQPLLHRRLFIGSLALLLLLGLPLTLHSHPSEDQLLGDSLVCLL